MAKSVKKKKCSLIERIVYCNSGRGKKKSTCCWTGRNLDASPSQAKESAWKKQAGSGAACRELSRTGGAETRTSSVQPSARNSSGGGGSSSSRQSFGSHFLGSSDRFKHQRGFFSYQLWFQSHTVGSWMLSLRLKISLRSLPKRLHIRAAIRSLLPVRAFFLPLDLAAVRISPWKRDAAAASAGSDSLCLCLVSKGGVGSDRSFPHHFFTQSNAPLSPWHFFLSFASLPWRRNIKQTSSLIEHLEK